MYLRMGQAELVTLATQNVRHVAAQEIASAYLVRDYDTSVEPNASYPAPQEHSQAHQRTPVMPVMETAQSVLGAQIINVHRVRMEDF